MFRRYEELSKWSSDIATPNSIAELEKDKHSISTESDCGLLLSIMMLMIDEEHYLEERGMKNQNTYNLIPSFCSFCIQSRRRNYESGI